MYIWFLILLFHYIHSLVYYNSIVIPMSQLVYWDLWVQKELDQCAQQLVCLQDQMKALKIQIHENRETVTRVELEETQLKKKLTSLEENLNSSVPDTIKVAKLQNCLSPNTPTVLSGNNRFSPSDRAHHLKTSLAWRSWWSGHKNRNWNWRIKTSSWLIYRNR